MPNPLPPKRLAELRRLRSLSTTREFAVHRYDNDDGDINYQLQGDGGEGEVLTNIFESINANNRADAAYLAALLNSAEALLDAAEELFTLRINITDTLDAFTAGTISGHGPNSDVTEQVQCLCEIIRVKIGT